MSDFAARLVARAQGRGAILAPRAAPRFAPEPGDSFSMESPAPWIDSTPVRAVDRPAVDQPLDRSPEWPTVDAPAATDAAVSETAAMPDGMRVSAPPAANAPERNTTLPAVTPPPIQAEAAAAIDAVTPVPPSRSAPMPLIGAEEASEVSAVTVLPSPIRTEVVSDVSAVSVAPPQPAPDHEPMSAPARMVAPAANDRVPRSAEPASLPEPTPPPVVIEIGAVEFRTIQPAPPAAAPPARPAPSLTLDAYLAQRASRPGGR